MVSSWWSQDKWYYTTIWPEGAIGPIGFMLNDLQLGQHRARAPFIGCIFQIPVMIKNLIIRRCIIH